jgi:hypothetical protein
MRIDRALLKYGYWPKPGQSLAKALNFKLDILEYCEKSHLIEREQYYLDLLKPPPPSKLAGGEYENSVSKTLIHFILYFIMK